MRVTIGEVGNNVICFTSIVPSQLDVTASLGIPNHNDLTSLDHNNGTSIALDKNNTKKGVDMRLTLLLLFLHSTSITIIAVHPSVSDILANSSFSDIEHDNTEYL
jgi:hypothetical protein